MLQRNVPLDSTQNGQLPVLAQFYILSVAQSNDNDYEQLIDATLKVLFRYWSKAAFP